MRVLIAGLALISLLAVASRDPAFAFGAMTTVCAGQQPTGWAVQNVSTNFTQCGGGQNNMWTLIELNGANHN